MMHGIWQPSNGGTRRQNGHWQSGGGVTYNAIFYSNYPFKTLTRSNYYSFIRGISTERNFGAIDTLTITGDFSNTPVDLPLYLFSDYTDNKGSYQTGSTLIGTDTDFWVTFPYFAFAFVLPDDTSAINTTIYIDALGKETGRTQTFTLEAPPKNGYSGVDTMYMPATATIDIVNHKISMTVTVTDATKNTLRNDYGLEQLNTFTMGVNFALYPVETVTDYPVYNPESGGDFINNTRINF